MLKRTFLLCEFAKPTLSNLITSCFGSDFTDIFRKKQINYLYNYLSEINSKTILLEPEYIDKDYLEDYSNYYIKRFNNSGYKVARIHFFSETFDINDVNEALDKGSKNPKYKFICSSYLGFIIIKPLPKNFIGKTCLKPYESLLSNANKNILYKKYDVDLFGLKLSVNSIAFIEQDKVVSACATTAIWSALHALPFTNVRNIPACSVITMNAINHIEKSNNRFPSKELSNKQMLRALDIEGLRYHTEFLSDVSLNDFWETIRTYIDSSIPIILGGDIYRIDKNENLTLLAGHAVTIIGYKDKENSKALYIHDDRLGPFARATFSAENYDLPVQNKKEKLYSLELQEKESNGEWVNAHEIFYPECLIIPVDKKVRLPASYILNTCHFMKKEANRELLDKFMKDYYSKENKTQKAEMKNLLNRQLDNDFSFKVSLMEISDIRQKIINVKYKQTDYENYLLKRDFLTKSYSRLQWVSKFYLRKKCLFWVLFDATDIPQGDAVSGVFIENAKYSKIYLSTYQDYAKKFAEENPLDIDKPNFYFSFLKFLTKDKDDLYSYLSSRYGELRAPKYLKADEVKGERINRNKFLFKSYEKAPRTLENLFYKKINKYIWAIAHDGALLIGIESENFGHPTLTGFKPARIAGEIYKKDDSWFINSKSGRYSSSYLNADELLKNAREKFISTFTELNNQIEIENKNKY